MGVVDETNKKRTERVTKLLEEYFSTRSYLPGLSTITGTTMMRDDKTTDDIIADLMPLMEIEKDEVNDYMFFHDYKLASQPDGTLAWAIWRDVFVGI